VLALRSAPREQAGEIDPPGGAERGEHMAVRQGADDLHRPRRRQQPLTAQYGAHLLDCSAFSSDRLATVCFLVLPSSR
jgi:hypothetical protein